MIKTSINQSDIAQLLAADFIQDKQPLITSAGFDAKSEHAGSARQTFTIALSSATLNNIRASIKILYDQLIGTCWHEGDVLPFDMVRFDAFLNPADDKLQIIELNTRSVGLHDIVEWLDELTAQQLHATKTPALNTMFAVNQKKIHSALYGDDVPLLFMSRRFMPKWKYYEALVATYKSVHPVYGHEDYEVTPLGLVADTVTYTAITRKNLWRIDHATQALDDAGTIRILQPRAMRRFGNKDYLTEFNSPTILKSTIFKHDAINEYVAKKNELVLKITNSSGSDSVYLGPKCSEQQWRQNLLVAAQKPESWLIQEYADPPTHTIYAHGIGPIKARTQLGIFVLPNPDAPHEFTIDIVAKAYTGKDEYFTFDPSGLRPEIWFGNALELKA